MIRIRRRPKVYAWLVTLQWQASDGLRQATRRGTVVPARGQTRSGLTVSALEAAAEAMGAGGTVAVLAFDLAPDAL